MPVDFITVQQTELNWIDEDDDEDVHSLTLNSFLKVKVVSAYFSFSMQMTFKIMKLGILL